jgi:hypothetical protein
MSAMYCVGDVDGACEVELYNMVKILNCDVVIDSQVGMGHRWDEMVGYSLMKRVTVQYTMLRIRCDI